MRKLALVLGSLVLGSVANAQAEAPKAFDCMDAKTFQINSQCMSDRIDQNIDYQDMQMNIANSASLSDENVMASIKFYPKTMHIEIVAHRDALTDNTLSASVKY